MPLAVVLICATLVHLGEGPGLLRLHSTYRHDLKIYSSDEGRVQVNGSISSCGFGSSSTFSKSLLVCFSVFVASVT